MEYTPWPIGRPYDGGFRYNCMVLKVGASSQYFQVKTEPLVETLKFCGSVLSTVCYSPCEIQLTLEDSGDEKATSLGYSIGDETCEVTWILFQCSLLKFFMKYNCPNFGDYIGFSRCQRFVHCARSLLQWEKSPLGGSASNRSSTSETNFWFT